nr:T9SS type A sorting domain-containing protein [Candidatus Neomarinimicrobiota bacterium]
SANHDLTIPLSDRWATYYYAVVCTDAVGNTGLVSTAKGPANNKLRGIPVISLSPPATFAADGDLSEWESSGIQPFQMGVTVNSMGTPKVIGTVDDDADASVKLYLAADDTVLYLAADVTDNDFNVGEGNWWEQDALELFIGLFDKRGARQGGFSRGAAPHYKLVFKGDTTWKEMGTAAGLGKSGDGNYYNTGVVGSPDAIIEFKIRFDALAAIDGDSVFKPVKGMRIPIEPVWHDNDGAGWEGNIVMSKTNNDNAWQTPAAWSHTFIGNYDGNVLSTDDLVATTFSLKENYPNPFNPTTTIEYSIGIAGPTKLMVFDVLGREVVKLVDEYRPIGSHKVVWRASNMPSGIYFYRLETSTFTRTHKMILMK